MPTSDMASTTTGLTPVEGSVPADSAETVPFDRWRVKASAIWLRPEL